MKLRYGFLIAALVTTGGCASTETTTDPYASDPSANCVRIRSVRNWNAIDDDHLWLEVSGKRQYLLTLWSRCPGIRYARTIALSNAGGRICPSDFGSVTFADAGTLTRCQIEDVELVGSLGEAEAIVQDRKAHDD
ncbi:MAG: DUF6491 family protein [Woeseiaceae bacterium]|nr:DUF6491 family protein [Woeseiaceae bacterium]